MDEQTRQAIAQAAANMPSLSDRAASRRRSRRKGRREWDGDLVREADSKWRQRRRTRQRGLPVEDYSRDDVWERTCGLCGICGVALDPDEPWQVDHIVPIAMPGSPGDVLSNAQPSHPLCNNRKGHRSAASILPGGDS